MRRANKRNRRFWRSTHGFAAAEAALLTLLFLGVAILVGGILRPAIRAAVRNLNQELAGRR